MKYTFFAFWLAFILGGFLWSGNCAFADKNGNDLTMNVNILERFRQAAENGSISGLIAARSTFNVDAATMGGHFWWHTYSVNGWKLQFNVISGWWRILNADNERVARGTSERQLWNLLENRPVSTVQNYFEEGCCFSITQAGVHSGRTAVLVHGWGVRSSSMQKLADALAQNGYDAFNYDYPTSKMSVGGHGDVFLLKFKELLAKLPPDEKIFVLTHSMGGLLLRSAMSKMSRDECSRINAIVMLGPPNKGSMLAYFGKIPGVELLNASLGDMAPSADSFTMNIPSPSWLPPVGIIAGSHDGKVSVENTRLPAPLEYEHIVVDSTHPGLRNPEKVMKYILAFFEKKSFKDEK